MNEVLQSRRWGSNHEYAFNNKRERLLYPANVIEEKGMVNILRVACSSPSDSFV